MEVVTTQAKRPTRLLIAATVLAQMIWAPAAIAGTCGVAHFDAIGDVGRGAATNITSLVSSELDIRGGYDLVLAAEEGETRDGCSSDLNCLKTFAKGGGHEHVVGGQVRAVAGQYEVTATLYEVRSGRQLRTVTQTMERTADVLIEAVPLLVVELITGEKPDVPDDETSSRSSSGPLFDDADFDEDMDVDEGAESVDAADDRRSKDARWMKRDRRGRVIRDADVEDEDEFADELDLEELDDLDLDDITADSQRKRAEEREEADAREAARKAEEERLARLAAEEERRREEDRRRAQREEEERERRMREDEERRREEEAQARAERERRDRERADQERREAQERERMRAEREEADRRREEAEREREAEERRRAEADRDRQRRVDSEREAEREAEAERRRAEYERERREEERREADERDRRRSDDRVASRYDDDVVDLDDDEDGLVLGSSISLGSGLIVVEDDDVGFVIEDDDEYLEEDEEDEELRPGQVVGDTGVRERRSIDRRRSDYDDSSDRYSKARDFSRSDDRGEDDGYTRREDDRRLAYNDDGAPDDRDSRDRDYDRDYDRDDRSSSRDYDDRSTRARPADDRDGRDSYRDRDDRNSPRRDYDRDDRSSSRDSTSRDGYSRDSYDNRDRDYDDRGRTYSPRRNSATARTTSGARPWVNVKAGAGWTLYYPQTLSLGMFEYGFDVSVFALRWLSIDAAASFWAVSLIEFDEADNQVRTVRTLPSFYVGAKWHGDFHKVVRPYAGVDIGLLLYAQAVVAQGTGTSVRPLFAPVVAVTAGCDFVLHKNIGVFAGMKAGVSHAQRIQETVNAEWQPTTGVLTLRGGAFVQF